MWIVREVFTSGGATDSSWGSPIYPYIGSSDGIVVKFNGSGTYLWHSYFGSAANDNKAIALAYTPDSLVAAGLSSAEWGSPVVDPKTGIGEDVWVLRLVPPPSALTLDNTSLTAQQTTVGNLATGGGESPFTYSLETSGATCTATNGAGNSGFAVNNTASTLERVSAGAGTYQVCIQTTDNFSNTYQKAFTITVIDIPTDISLSTNLGSAGLTDVGTLSTTNGVPSYTYSLQTSGSACTSTNGAGNAAFQISGSTLQRRTTTGAGTYNLCVQTSDSNTSTYQKTFTVTIYAVPSALALNSTTVTTQQINVGTLSSTGGRTPLVYSLQTSGSTCNATNGAGNSAFQIVSTTLQRRIATTAGSYNICAQAADAFGVTTQRAFTITVSQAPNDITLSSAQVITDETDVGTFTTSNGAAPFSYSLRTTGTVCNATNGASNSSFGIASDTLQRNGGTTKGSYNICVQTTDNLGDLYQRAFVITVLDPPSDITLSSASGTTGLIDIGTLATVDGDDPFTYTFQNSGITCDATNAADNALFEISSDIFQRKLTTPAGTYAVCLQTEDDSARAFQKAFTIVLMDGPTVFEVESTGTSQQTDVGEFSASGTPSPYTFSLSDTGAVCNAGNSTDNASFTISGTTLERNAGTPAGDYTICAQVEDSAGGITQKVFSITILQSPTDIGLSNNTVSALQTDVGAFSTSDGQTPFVYSFETSGATCTAINGAGNSSFNINSDVLERQGGTIGRNLFHLCADHR